MKALPTLDVQQSWCCANGCGECRPVQVDFEYSRTEDLDGKPLEIKTEKVWGSHCCHADLMLWDEGKKDFIAVNELSI